MGDGAVLEVEVLIEPLVATSSWRTGSAFVVGSCCWRCVRRRRGLLLLLGRCGSGGGEATFIGARR